MKVKILEIHRQQNDCENYNCYNSDLYTLTNTTDWEEVSEEDVYILSKYIYKLQNQYDEHRLMMVVESQLKPQMLVSQCLEKIKEEQKQKEEKEKVAEAKQAKKLAEKAKKEEETKKQLYDELKKEFGG